MRSLTLDDSIALIPIFSALVILVRLTHARLLRRYWGESFKATLTLGVLGIWLSWGLPHLTAISLGVWCLLYLSPALLRVQLKRSVWRSDYQGASRWAHRLYWLSPSREMRYLQQIYQLMDAMTQGEVRQPSDLDHLKRETPRLWQTAIAQLYALSHQWEDLLTFLKTPDRGVTLGDQLWTRPYLIRALGETQKLGDLIRVSLEYLPQKPHHDDWSVEMMLSAFLGDSETLALILNGPLKMIHTDYKRYWFAVATQAQGDIASSRAQLRSLTEHTSLKVVRQAGLKRLDLTPRPIPQQAHQVAEWVRSGLRVAHYERPNRIAWSSWTLLSLIVVTYLWEERQGGSRDIRVLYELGAMWTESVSLGEWWRLWTANFLHFGLLHLSLNAICLIWISRVVERHLGMLKHLLLWLIVGPLAMGSLALLMHVHVLSPQLLLGASVILMALIGFEMMTQYAHWRTTHHPIAYRQLRILVSIVVAQSCVDLIIEQVSFSGHLAGLLWGITLGLISTHTERESSSAR